MQMQEEIIMSEMKPLGNVILTCSGYKSGDKTYLAVEGISIASFANTESTIGILRKAADLLEEGDYEITIIP